MRDGMESGINSFYGGGYSLYIDGNQLEFSSALRAFRRRMRLERGYWESVEIWWAAFDCLEEQSTRKWWKQ